MIETRNDNKAFSNSNRNPMNETRRLKILVFEQSRENLDLVKKTRFNWNDNNIKGLPAWPKVTYPFCRQN